MQHVLSTGGGKALMDPADTLMLLLDHQTGLFQVVKDIPVAQLRANVTALAKLATLLKLPVITNRIGPRRTKRSADAGAPRGCTARAVHSASWRGQRLG